MESILTLVFEASGIEQRSHIQGYWHMVADLGMGVFYIA
jgi:hypothetical protein